MIVTQMLPPNAHKFREREFAFILIVICSDYMISYGHSYNLTLYLYLICWLFPEGIYYKLKGFFKNNVININSRRNHIREILSYSQKECLSLVVSDFI